MHLLVINPNTTQSMTDRIGAAAQAAASASTHVTALNPNRGPASIQGAKDGLDALPGLFDVFESQVLRTDTYDAVIIACFDDTGLMTLKQQSPIPVIGIGEAAYYMAHISGMSYSVVTTLPISLPVLEDNVKAYGFPESCVGVRASGVPVLALEDENIDTDMFIEQEIQAAIKEDGCSCIVLGCAGMTGLVEKLERTVPIPIIDPVVAAVNLAEATVKAVPRMRAHSVLEQTVQTG